MRIPKDSVPRAERPQTARSPKHRQTRIIRPARQEYPPRRIRLRSTTRRISKIVFVPLVATPNSKFARYHANQGLVLFVLEFVYGIFYSLLIEFFGVIFPMQITLGGYGRSIAYSVLVVLFGLVWIFLLVITILGIVNAAKGRAKELPIVGKFRFFK